ncbi:hypothetical protein CYANOKiyG1_38720 [Okeania sp. KiyG1]|nr:hypothetical protein CYANOKiyG1_38720 [Okeania sp. KiyG1]
MLQIEVQNVGCNFINPKTITMKNIIKLTIILTIFTRKREEAGRQIKYKLFINKTQVIT